MKKNFYLFLLMLCAVLPFTACSSDDDPVEADRMESASVAYAIAISEDMLRYFNITAEYINADGQKVGKQISGPTTEIKTTATSFPAKRPLTFSVTRTEEPAPTTSPAWNVVVSIVVAKLYQPSGSVENSMKNEAMSFTPLPDKFNTWADGFIKDMATGYTVTINADGKVKFE